MPDVTGVDVVDINYPRNFAPSTNLLELEFYSNKSSVNRKIDGQVVANEAILKGDVSALTELTAVDGANDFVVVRDATDSTNKKVKPNNLPSPRFRGEVANNAALLAIATPLTGDTALIANSASVTGGSSGVAALVWYTGSAWDVAQLFPVAAPGATIYSAGSGAIVKATGAGVTFVRTTASVGTLTVPSGIDLVGLQTINFTPAESATAAYTLNIVFQGSRPYNQDTSDNMTDLYAPNITTIEKLTGQGTYPTTAAGNNPAWTAKVDTAGTLTCETLEFAEVGNGGANAVAIILNF